MPNVEKCRLEVEVTNDSNDFVAIVYEDETGWHVEEEDGFPEKAFKRLRGGN